MAAHSLSAALQRIGELQARLPGPVAVLIGVVALGAAMLPDIWLVTRHVTVMAHEGAHATVGSAMGRRITGITFARTADGQTRMQSGSPPGTIVATVVGYLGPSAFGILAAELVSIGHIIAVVWAALVGLVALLVPLRKSFGFVTVVVAIIALFLVARYATVGAQVMAGYAIAWFLLLSGVRVVMVRGSGAADAGLLRDMTRIPRGFWSLFWLAGSLAALGFGATLLV